MLKLTSALTVTVWTALFVWVISMFLSGAHPTAGDLAFAAIAIVLSCVAVALSVAAVLRRSRAAVRWLLGISVPAACWSVLDLWMMLSPLTVVGHHYLSHTTLMGWLWVVGLAIMVLLPWLWGAVCVQLQRA